MIKIACMIIQYSFKNSLNKVRLRVREEINLHFQESRRPHGKARGGRIAGYLTDEQRSQAGWIGALKCEVIFEQALSILVHHS